jgi:hypothetical protein
MAAMFSTKGALEHAGPRPVLAVAANALADLARAMRGRLAHGRTVDVFWPDGTASLSPGPETHVAGTSVVLSPDDCAAIEALPVARGDYALPSGKLTVRVVPVEIFDGTRTRVERVIG